MPALKPKQPAKTTAGTKADFVGLGWAVALADLAQDRGMHVKDVIEFPDHLTAAGLPPAKEIPPWVRVLAHRICQDRSDGALFRLGEAYRAGWRDQPERTPAEAKEIVVRVEQQRQVEARAAIRQALVREDKKNDLLLTPEERRAAKAPVVPVPPARRRLSL